MCGVSNCTVIKALSGTTSGLNVSECGQMGVMMMPFTSD